MVTLVNTYGELAAAVAAYRSFIRLGADLNAIGETESLGDYSGYIDGDGHTIFNKRGRLFDIFTGTLSNVDFRGAHDLEIAEYSDKAIYEDIHIIQSDLGAGLFGNGPKRSGVYTPNSPPQFVGGRITLDDDVAVGTSIGRGRPRGDFGGIFSFISDLHLINGDFDIHLRWGGTIGRLFHSGSEEGFVKEDVPILINPFVQNALPQQTLADGSVIPWDDAVWESVPESVNRVAPWMSPGAANLPNNATFGLRVYRNQGAGWQLLAANTDDDDYPTDGLMNVVGDGYQFTDSYSLPQISGNNSGRAADPAVAADQLDVPPPNAVAVARHANGFYLLGAGKVMMASLPGYPVAYPRQYRRELPEEILDIVEYADRFLVFTQSHVYRVSGISPAGLSVSELELTYPPRGGAARVGAMVYYAVREGVAAAGGGGDSALASAAQLTVRDFERYANGAAFAAEADGRYYLFPSGGGDALGFSSRENNAVFYARFFDRPMGTEAFLTPEGDTRRLHVTAAASHPSGGMVLAANIPGGSSVLRRWEPLIGRPQVSRWRSRVYRFRRPVDFRAIKVRLANDVRFGNRIGGVPPPDRPTTIAGGGIGVARSQFYGPGDNVISAGEYSLSIGGTDFIGALENNSEALVRLIADGTVVYEDDAAHFLSQAIDIPALGRATDWQLEIIGNEIITGAALALSKTQLNQIGI